MRTFGGDVTGVESAVAPGNIGIQEYQNPNAKKCKIMRKKCGQMTIFGSVQLLRSARTGGC
jgi:hypothetical protein